MHGELISRIERFPLIELDPNPSEILREERGKRLKTLLRDKLPSSR